MKSNQPRLFSRWSLACLAIILLSGLLYLPVMSGLAIWDDHSLIAGTGIGGGYSFRSCFTEPFLMHYFRPMVSVSFFLDHKLWGTGTFFYHQTNLLIHVLTTAVLIGLIRTAFGNRRYALAGGLLFAIQPTQVSTVAWIGGRTDSLCTLFMALFSWALIGGVRSSGKQRLLYLSASTMAFALALLTKEQMLGTLLLVPFAVTCFGTREEGRSWRTQFKLSLSFLVTGIAFISAWCLFYPQPLQPILHSFPMQLSLAGRTFTYYTLLLLCPAPNWMHQLSLGPLERLGSWTVWFGFGILAGALALLIRWTRSTPALAWMMAYILLTMLPISNLLPLPSLVVAPYRVGVTGLGVAVLLGYFIVVSIQKAAWIQTDLFSTPRFRLRLPAAPLALGCAYLLWCLGLTAWGTMQWQDEQTIFGAFARYDPDSIVARYNLTTTLLKSHKSRPAIAQLETMLTLIYGSIAWKQEKSALHVLKTDPDILNRVRENQGNSIRPEVWLASIYGQLGFARLNCDDDTGARREFRIGAQIDTSSDEANLGLAQLAFDAGDYRKAAGYLHLALVARPNRAEAHMLLAHTYVGLKRWKEARREFQAWADLQPWIGQAYVELAEVDTRLGNFTSARNVLEYALQHSICDIKDIRSRLDALQHKLGQNYL